MKNSNIMMTRLFCVLIICIIMVSIGLSEDGMRLVQVPATEHIPLYHELKYGMDGTEVSALQTRLLELGYYSGNISGRLVNREVN